MTIKLSKFDIARLQNDLDGSIAKHAIAKGITRAEATQDYLRTDEGRAKYNHLAHHRELSGDFADLVLDQAAPVAVGKVTGPQADLDREIAEHMTVNKVSRPEATAAVFKTAKGRELYAKANAPAVRR